MRALTFAKDVETEVSYQELLREPALSIGRYRLPAGAVDPQQPHTEDEVYVVRHGKGVLRTPGGDTAAVPGAVLFVPAGEHHQFVDIEEALDLLVLFAPAENTGADE